MFGDRVHSSARGGATMHARHCCRCAENTCGTRQPKHLHGMQPREAHHGPEATWNPEFTSARNRSKAPSHHPTYAKAKKPFTGAEPLYYYSCEQEWYKSYNKLVMVLILLLVVLEIIRLLKACEQYQYCRRRSKIAGTLAPEMAFQNCAANLGGQHLWESQSFAAARLVSDYARKYPAWVQGVFMHKSIIMLVLMRVTPTITAAPQGW